MKKIGLLILAPCVISAAAAQPLNGLQPERPTRLNCKAPKLADAEDLFQGDQIICRDKKNGVVSIPASQVIEIAYDLTSLGNPVSEEPSDYFCPEGGIFGLGLLALGPLIASEINSIRLRPHPYVFLHWNDDIDDRTAIFRIDQKQMLALVLAKLSDVTGKEWQDRLQEREEEEQEEIRAVLDQRFQIRLDRQVRIGEVDLPAGSYEVAVSPKLDGGGRLFFDKRTRFNGKRTLAQARIEVLDRALQANNQYEIIYGKTNNRAETVMEIRTPRTVVRLIPGLHPTAEMR